MQKPFIYSLLSTILFLFFQTTELKAQEGYSLSFQVKGWSDTTAYLGYYYGESTYIKDTAKVDTKGRFTFKSNTSLLQGMYMVVRGKTKAFELLVGEDQEFEMFTDSADYVSHMRVSGDVNNQILYENMRYNQDMNGKAEPYIKQIRDSLVTEEQKKEAQQSLKKLNQEVVTHLAQASNTNKGTLVSNILKMQEKVEVPQDLNKDQQFQYYKSHYWDHFDLANDAFLRLPNSPYRKKVEDYLDKLFLQSTDSLKVGIEEIVSRAKPNPDTYKYAVWNITIKYQNPKYMGQDGLFVYLYDEYYASGEMDFWADESLKNNLKERADQLRKSLLGQQAQNLVMLDENLQRVSLYNIKNKYTVIYFYDPDCGHCKKETPRLADFYKSTKHDVEVFAVSADTSMVKMKKYIEDLNLTWISANGPRTLTPQYQKLYDANSTPTIYLLDEKKKIIAKKLEASRIEEFLDNYERLD